MCLGTVFVSHDGIDEQICTSVTHVDIQDEALVFTDLLGCHTRVQGMIYEMDLAESRIYVKESLPS
ncbi:CooT family nickel-binding protein [Adlercreutzia sp. ZJ138]|uniref:CooT family nickel-binding protein n=1 Tax=Adlercreutzia sp. ZJ138 TaxID=2709405 RepID=UPI0013ED61B5